MNAVPTFSASESMKTFEDVLTLNKRAMESAVETSSQLASSSYHQAMITTRDQMDAMMQSGSILLDGMQALTRTWIDMAQKTTDETVAQGKATTGVKSIHELLQLTQDFTKLNMEKALANGSMLSEQTLKVAEEAARPLAERVTPALEQVLRQMAPRT